MGSGTVDIQMNIVEIGLLCNLLLLALLCCLGMYLLSRPEKGE